MKKNYFPVIICLMAVMILGSLAPEISPAQKRYSIATTVAGGPWYLLGGAWAKLVNTKVPEVNISVETGGTVPNVQLVHRKKVDFALTNPEIAYEGYMGTGWAKEGVKYDSIRALFPIHASETIVFCLESNAINSLMDLAGKNVSFGPRQSTSDIVARNVFAVLGVKPNIRNMSFQSTMDAMVDGLIDAAFLNLAHPAGPVLTLQTTKKIKFIKFTKEDFAKILKAYPMYRTITMAQSIYRDFPPGGYPTLELGTAVIAGKDLPDDLVYTIVKATFENTKMLREAMASATYTVPERVPYLVLPLHPGALRYYRERKIDLPANLIPPP
jgi:TRAP transporter TAXI family solute receptor